MKTNKQSIIILLLLLFTGALSADESSFLHLTMSNEINQSETLQSRKEKVNNALLEQLVQVDRMLDNYDRRLTDFDEESTTADTLQWSNDRTTKELVTTLTPLLAQRKALAKRSPEQLEHALSARRIYFGYYRNSSAATTEYGILLDALAFFFEKVNASEEVTIEQKETVNELLEGEVAAAITDHLAPSALYLLRRVSFDTNDPADLSRLRRLLPLFKGTPEEVVPEVVLLEQEARETLHPLMHSLISADKRDEAREAEWRRIDDTIEARFAALLKKANTSPYKSEVEAKREAILPNYLNLRVDDYDYDARTVQLQLRGIVRAPLRLTRATITNHNEANKVSLKDYTEPTKRVLYEDLTDRVPGIGRYSYSLDLRTKEHRNAYASVDLAGIDVQSDRTIKGTQITVRDSKTGAPAKGVLVQLFKAGMGTKQSLTPNRTYTTDREGMLFIPYGSDEELAEVIDDRLVDGVEKIRIIPYRPYDAAPEHAVTETELYTDRPIYRYGQQVEAAIVSFSGTTKKKSTRPYQPGVAILKCQRDGQEVTLAEKTYTTNENGVAYVAFDLPESETFDSFSVKTKEGKHESLHFLNVRSYKLNHLNVSIEALPNGITANQPLIVRGRVTDLNNLPTPAKLTLRYDDDRTLSAETASDGTFTLTTPPLSERVPPRFFYYHRSYVTVSAVDPLGNVADDTVYAPKDTTNIPIDADQLLTGDRFLDRDAFTLTTKDQPYNKYPFGDPTRYTFTVSLISKANGQTIDLGTIPANGTATYNKTDLPVGAYTLQLATTDAFGQKIVSQCDKPVILFSPKDKRPATFVPLWFRYDRNEKSADDDESLQRIVGRDLQLTVGSSLDATILVTVSGRRDGKIYYQRYIPVKDELQELTIPDEKLPAEPLTIKASVYYKHSFTGETVHVEAPAKPDESLTIVGIDEEESLSPGAHVERTLVIKDANGAPLKNMPVIVTVFDEAVARAADDEEHWSYILKEDDDYYGGEMVEDMALTSLPIGAQPRLMKSSVAVGDAVAMNGDAATGTPAERSNFSETAFFTALLTTNDLGEAHYAYDLPHTQTKYLTKVFAFSRDLKAQQMQEFHFEVYTPLSVELNLPRYLIAGDRLESQAMLRNTLDHALESKFTITAGDQELSSGTTTLVANGTSSIPFTTITSIDMDSLLLHATLQSDENQDALRRSLPILSDLTRYRVAVPFSVYKGTQAALELPKIDLNVDSFELDLFFNPITLLLTTLAEDHSAEANNLDLEKISFFELLNRYYLYGAIYDALQKAPEVKRMLTDAIPALRAGAQGVTKDRDRYVSYVASTRRLADAATLADYYTFVTDDQAMQARLQALAVALMKYNRGDKGFSLSPHYPSPWLTAYTLSVVSRLPYELHTDQLQQAIDRSTAYLIHELQDKNSFYKDAMSFAIVWYRLYNGKKSLPTEVKKRADKQAAELHKSYRQTWTSRLLHYSSYLRYYGDVAQRREVEQFIRDVASHATTDGDRFLLQSYLVENKVIPLSDEVIRFMLTHKQATFWYSPYVVETVTALLSHLAPTKVTPGATIMLGDQTITPTAVEIARGAIQRTFTTLPASTTLSMQGISSDFFFGGLSYNVLQKSAEVTPTGSSLKVEKQIFKYNEGTNSSLTALSDRTPAEVGDQLVVRYVIETDRDLSLINLLDYRPATSEPGYDFAGYRSADHFYYVYRRYETFDLISIDYLPRGRHIIEMRATATVGGTFTFAPAQIISTYAPEFVGNSSGGQINVVYPKQ